MRFESFIPAERLRPYIRYYVIAENELESAYKVFPCPALVMGFQYKGNLSKLQEKRETRLTSSGITGLANQCQVFKSSAGIGTVLIYFTGTGFAHFSSQPANELFGLSLSLNDVFEKDKVIETEEKLSLAITDTQRIQIIEQFLFSQLKEIEKDKLIVEAVKLIYQTKGAIRIKELNERLFISQSPFEKRFRKLVGTTPKKFASIVRFNAVLDQMNGAKSFTDICYDNNFFDQAHFIKDFKQFTGDTPENFNRLV